MIGLTTSSKTMDWSAACEKTRSKEYVLLLRAFGPMDSSTCFPITPFVLTTTALFSWTSRLLRPLHRTTTVMFVSSLKSNSRSLRLMPAAGEGAVDETDSARETAPDLSLRDDAVNALGGLVLGGLMLEARVPCRTLARPAVAVRVGGAMSVEDGVPLLRGAGRLESRMKALMKRVALGGLWPNCCCC